MLSRADQAAMHKQLQPRMNHLQHGTPAWASEILLAPLFPEGRPCVEYGVTLDVCAGDGSFLAAIPYRAPAYAVEIDAQRAAAAQARTGRKVLVADVLTVELPSAVTRIVGNPPFKATFVAALMQRAHDWLPEGGSMHLILPAYFFKSAAKVVGYAGRWEVKAELLPYSALFPGLAHPLTWCEFKKGGAVLIGFRLYHEAVDIQRMRAKYRAAMAEPGQTWRHLVYLALQALGGQATLQQLYAEIQPHRPTDNPWWKEQIRKHVQRHHHVGPSSYALFALEP